MKSENNEKNEQKKEEIFKAKEEFVSEFNQKYPDMISLDKSQKDNNWYKFVDKDTIEPYFKNQNKNECHELHPPTPSCLHDEQCALFPEDLNKCHNR